MGTQELHILLADDNAVNRKVLQHMLGRLGHHVSMASTGQEAIDMATSNRYDLIFMDMMMPVVDGLEATRQIRASESGKRRTPIIAVTANVERTDEQACANAGMDAFLTKPFTLNQVRHSIDRFSAHQFNDSDEGGLNASILKTFVETMGADDVDFAIEVLGDLLTEGNRVRSSIQSALDSNMPVEVARHAHSLKSAAAVVGAQQLAGICRSMEGAALSGRLDDVRLALSHFDGALNLVRQDVDAFRAKNATTPTGI
jgi:CheY-like chemotaxis protein/HPt (histidine-containing phosphotransfer) domain-containing protein